MNAKRKLNCYFFSNLIVCFLSLNFIISDNKAILKVTSSQENPSLINVFKTEVLDTEVPNINLDTDTTTKISVSMKTVASKNVLPYVKPSYNSVTGSNLVNYARNYLGLPYVYAGDSLSTGTDCSGFTRLIYREFGISLGRTVGSQLYSGTYVSRNDLQPGDLVFYGYSGNNASHVAIYMGNGLIIHQSNPRNGVKIDSVNIMVYVTARRIITADVKVLEKEELSPETKDDLEEELSKSNEKEPEKPNNKEISVENNNEKENNDMVDLLDSSTNSSLPEVKEETKIDEKVTDSDVNHNINDETNTLEKEDLTENKEMKEETDIVSTNEQNNEIQENTVEVEVEQNLQEEISNLTVMIEN